jgi:hypothetical protein
MPVFRENAMDAGAAFTATSITQRSACQTEGTIYVLAVPSLVLPFGRGAEPDHALHRAVSTRTAKEMVPLIGEHRIIVLAPSTANYGVERLRLYLLTSKRVSATIRLLWSGPRSFSPGERDVEVLCERR